jgi:hypothetical protein
MHVVHILHILLHIGYILICILSWAFMLAGPAWRPQGTADNSRLADDITKWGVHIYYQYAEYGQCTPLHIGFGVCIFFCILVLGFAYICKNICRICKKNMQKIVHCPYYAYYAYCNMQNMQNMTRAYSAMNLHIVLHIFCILLHIFLHILHIFLHIRAYCFHILHIYAKYGEICPFVWCE